MMSWTLCLKLTFLRLASLKKIKSHFFYEIFKFQSPLCIFLKFNKILLLLLKRNGFYLALPAGKTYDLIITEQKCKGLACAGHQG